MSAVTEKKPIRKISESIGYDGTLGKGNLGRCPRAGVVLPEGFASLHTLSSNAK